MSMHEREGPGWPPAAVVQLAEELKRTRDRLAFSRELQQILAFSLNAEEVGRNFKRLTSGRWGFDRLDLLLLDASNRLLKALTLSDPQFPLAPYTGSWAEQQSGEAQVAIARQAEGPLYSELVWLWKSGYSKVVMVSLFHQGQFRGELLFSYRNPERPGPEKEVLLDLAGPLATAMENARLYTLAQKQLEMLSMVDRAGVAIALGEADLTPTLKRTLEEVRVFIGSHSIRFYRLDEKNGRLVPEVVVYESGRYSLTEEELIGSMAMRVGEGISGWVAATGQPYVTGDSERDPRSKHVEGTDYVDESLICVPVKARDKVLGVLTMAKMGLHQFGELEMMLARSLASQMAIAVENARLYQSQLLARSHLEDDIEQIKSLESVREDFLYSVSHELKTPLAAIAATLELTERAASADQAQLLWSYRSLLCRSSERLKRLVDNLLETSKITSGSLELYRQEEDLSLLVEEAVTRQHPETELKQIQIEVQLDGKLGPLYLDRDRILQVLTNLLSNAVRFSLAKGLVTVRATGEDSLVRVEVVDRGLGVSLADLPHIFERFFHSRTQISSSASGVGMGLFLSKALVEAHGGTIGLESSTGEGTTVHFSLPKARPAPAG